MSKVDDENELALNKNDNEKVEDSSEYQKISLNFVDSIFNKASNIPKEDPLNGRKESVIFDKKIMIQQKSDLETPQKNDINNNQKITKTSSTKSSKKQNYKQNSTEKNTAVKNKNLKSINKSSSVKKIDNTLGSTKNSKKNNNHFLNNQNSTISEKFKANRESEKEKKLYQEKVKILENRITALKNQENDIIKKRHANELRQNYLNKKKQEKNDFKKQLLSYDIDKRNALDERRKAIKEKNMQLNKELKESLAKTKTSKMNNYKKLKNEKKIGLIKISQNNHNIERYGKYNVTKIKKERERIKKNEIKKLKKLGRSMDNYYIRSCENNRNETDKLKERVKKLEQLEMKYVKSLNETKLGIKRNNSGGLYYYNRDMSPIKKLDLDEQKNGMSSQKRNKKKIAKDLFKSYDGNNDNIDETEDENNDEEKIIKVEKKIGVDEKH
jgi:hypothetical protein